MRFIFFFLTFLFTHLQGQSQHLKGLISNSKDQPISGAKIASLTNDTHAHSDDNGSFILNAIKVGDSIKVSHPEYNTKLIRIDNLKKTLIIKLEEKIITLDEIVITPKLNALNIITEVDLQVTPVNSSQGILRQVPGLIIGQHAGGGKAEQIFLRGFDIDHGTDITISTDGIPVNMVSHAHGQGYSDLHFIIPETIDNVDFGKGSYYADKGDFNTAGYVNFNTKDRLKNSIISAELGQFNTQRLLGMFNLLNSFKQSAYFAVENLTSDGPFQSSQNFYRFNAFGKYIAKLTNRDQIKISASHFKSKWDASGQIPERAVNSGLIDRFGAIDDTEGGNTSRSNFIVNYNKRVSDKSSIDNTIFYSHYDFELYSNFTFFLEDPINGDQIKQKESRSISGLSSTYKQQFDFKQWTGQWRLGVSLRNDRSEDNELSHTLNRQTTLTQHQLGDINQTNTGVFADLTLNYNKWTFNAALRLDHFNFKYNDALVTNYTTQSESQSILSPKLNILYNPTNTLQFYLKGGKGFHSNDTRVVVQQRGNNILPASYGSDLGVLWKPKDQILLNIAYWYLFLEQEFVYVGDAGIVEPSGKTRRQGIDFSFRYQPLQWLFSNLDVTYSHARATEEPNDADYIPLAPNLTIAGGINIRSNKGFYGGLKARHLNDRPANEDNSIIADGYTVFDANFGYEFKKFNFMIEVQNLFDTEWNETQFATESRLQNETSPVEEIHFTPGTPFNLKGKIQYRF